ncbi:PTS sugar transporter subunit IIA [Nocardioides sp. URHA0032]|uniref:PTS sugar transporter subunit IIA n=1 Tax=Nocardioides sp. URHA0032 TaxID=1380388 RepID=UPI000564E5B0|nr:PTS sugar transporter subunit IIA [Nocardioides sp. URHA0032]
MAELVDLQTVSVQQDLGSTLEECVRSLATLLDGTGRLSDVDAFVADVLTREAKGSTALPGGVALPHARSAAVLEPTVAVASLPTPIATDNGHDFDLVFLLAVPDDQSGAYLQLLRTVTTAAVKPGFRADCRAADSPARLSILAADAFA